MRIYNTIIQTKSLTWNNSNEILNALKWALYCSEVYNNKSMIYTPIEFLQGYNHVSQTVYYDEFQQNCQLIRQYISSINIPSDFIPNAYGYLLHVCSIAFQFIKIFQFY